MRKETNGIVIEIPDAEIEKYALENLKMRKIEDDLDKLIGVRAAVIADMILKDMIENDWEELLEQMDDADLREYMESNYDMMSAEDFADDWTNYVDDCTIEDYARDQFDMMTEEEAIEFAKEKLDG